MPRFYRSMLIEDGKPKVGAGGKLLGVRVPPVVGNAKPDLEPGENGIVQPRSGGMSVRSNWRQLPLHLIPRRLNSVTTGITEATGSNALHCWRFGEGDFADDIISGSLCLRVDNPSGGHGVVEPIDAMHIDEFQSQLATTRSDWTIDEG